MEREIAFRAWDKSENQMSYSDTEFFDDMIAFRFKHWGIDVYTIDDIELMQFTGYRDRNGKDIYDGDILIPMSENIGSMTVYFENGAFYCKNKFQKWGLLSRCFDSDIQKIYGIYVIGNIYENPELLTK